MQQQRWLVILAALGLLVMLPPTVQADDTLAAANTITDGATSSGYVCYDDGCSPTDEFDWWKVYAYNGDQVRFEFSGTGNNMLWICINDGWVAKLKITDASGNNIAPASGEITADDDTPSKNIQTAAVTSAGWYYLRIRGYDSACNDGIDYSLTARLIKDYRDRDADGVIDNDDDCPADAGDSTEDKVGCPDADGDGWSNSGDAFPNDSTQWLDTDHDTYGDNWGGNNPDHCPYQYGTSDTDRYGCRDTDGDGFSDPDPAAAEGREPWFAHPTGGADAFKTDVTQWHDTDGDGYGDNWNNGSWNLSRDALGVGVWVDGATFPDHCPTVAGDSNMDRLGCEDTDNDGWSDVDDNWTLDDGADAFKHDVTQWHDRDRDGYGDNPQGLSPDAFPDNPTQWKDTDLDGYGDNRSKGSWQSDNFTTDATQWQDSDMDGFGDNQSGNEADGCVVVFGSSRFDRYGCPDSDGDGYSDPDATWKRHPEGFGDAFPAEPTQWHDIDGDGFGDNRSVGAWKPDSCPSTYGTSTLDRWGCPDRDGDGASDPQPELGWVAHPVGLADAFIDDPTQWWDSDGDGYGDEPDGTTPDGCKDTPGTSFIDRWGCPDADGDSVSDQGDRFSNDGSQWLDSDDDGFGDNFTGHQPDACPFAEVSKGVSVLDRFGCPDTDKDGYSDPDSEWLASPAGPADAFPQNRMQWWDTDGDGFGDNPVGSLRDDCPTVSGTSTMDLQGCQDSNSDGFSDEYGFSESQVALMASNPASSVASYVLPIPVFLLTVALVAMMRRGRYD